MRANDSPPDAPASPPAPAHPPFAVDASAAGVDGETARDESFAPSSRPGILLPVTARVVTETREGGHNGRSYYPDYSVRVVYLDGAAIRVTAEQCGPDMDLDGTFPAYAADALREIAETELRADDATWSYAGYASPVELWLVDADGDAIPLSEDEVEAIGLAGAWRGWRREMEAA